MSSIFARGRRLYAKIKDVRGVWQQVRTPFHVGDEVNAKQWADAGGGIKFRPRLAALSIQPGLLYAIALDPTVFPLSIKVGHTNTRVADRLNRFRTSSPRAIPLGAWNANKSDETLVLSRLPGRIGRSEVFICQNVEPFLDEIERILATR